MPPRTVEERAEVRVDRRRRICKTCLYWSNILPHWWDGALWRRCAHPTIDEQRAVFFTEEEYSCAFWEGKPKTGRTEL